MAAYIDLNPVRAGMVADLADYRWSSYGEAIGGGRKGNGKKAREGLVRAFFSDQGWASKRSAGSIAFVPALDGTGAGQETGALGGTAVCQRALARPPKTRRRWKVRTTTVLQDLGLAKNAALPGEVFHGWRGDRQQGVSRNEAFAKSRERFEQNARTARVLRGSGQRGAG